ncbi:MAG TPA: tetratricopeptide repeat protein [Sphingobium sp.]|nr:tetratricopeptide repeat protein [Sphingobium sp.]
MKRKPLLKIAASSLILAGTMAGCTGAALNHHAGASAGKLQEMAQSQARGAEQALAKRDAGRAVEIAEAAVAADPRNADYRTLLGRAYLMSGRFGSARTAFEDALALGSSDARTIVNLALVHVAQGGAAEARQVLADHVATLSAADYGLGMAMAGDPEEAIRVLGEAIHAPGAGARERQNLAYSYALAGRWVEARQMASADLPPLDAAKRVLGWAQTAQAGAESQRVIAMMGVAPRADDAGLPVRLALGAPVEGSAEVRQAQSDPVDRVAVPLAVADKAVEPVVTEDAGTEPEIAPMPAAFANTAWHEEQEAPETAIAEFVPVARQPAPEAVAAPPLLRPAQSPAVTVQSSVAPRAPMARSAMLRIDAPTPRPAAILRPVQAAKGSSWVVQLGAFSTAHAAQDSWSRYVRTNDRLGAFPVVHSEATVNGKLYHRLAVAGFADRSGADRLCVQIQSRGGDCFVRQGGPEAAPSRWTLASRPRLLAMR